ncbi:MAG: NAD-dependent epimerase/dehydratase family protein [Phycisphaerae bacterium]
MNAAVTGGSGFFGTALVKALLARGDCVRALVRREEAAAEMHALEVQPLMGDLTEPDGCDGLVAEGDLVFHAAAWVDMSGPWERYQRTTIEGTRHLLAAALPRRPRRFVYISSGAVYAPGAGRGGFCAARTPTRPASYNFYGRAKLEAERLVRSECERSGCPWTILRLGFLFGAGNRAFLNHFVPLAKRNRLFIIGSGDNRIATLYIDDAVRATVLASTQPTAAGKVYDVANDEPVTQREFIDATTEALDLPRCRRRIRKRVALVGAWLIERLSNWTGREAHISRALVALMSTDQVVDAGRIRAELGWRPEVSFAEGMRRTQEWHRRLQRELAAGGGDGPPAPAACFSR